MYIERIEEQMKKIKTNMNKLSQEYNEYGLTLEGLEYLYCRGRCPLKAGHKVKYEGKYYIVNEVSPGWHSFYHINEQIRYELNNEIFLNLNEILKSGRASSKSVFFRYSKEKGLYKL